MLKLYNWKLSPNCMKVRWVLHDLGLEFETQELDILKGAGKTPEYTQLNPSGRVPTLKDDALVVWESNAILLYLARKTQRLLPDDAAGQALVDQWLFWQSAHYYQPVVGLALERMVKPMFQQPTDEVVAEAHVKEFLRYTQTLESHLSQYEFLAGELSIADFSVASTLYTRHQLKLDISAYTHLNHWLQKMESRPSFAQSLGEASES